MKNIKNHIVETLPKSNIKIADRGKIDTPNKQILDRSFSWLGTGASIKSGSFKLVLRTQTFLLSEMMWSCKCFPHVSKMTTLTYNQADF